MVSTFKELKNKYPLAKEDIEELQRDKNIAVFFIGLIMLIFGMLIGVYL